MKELENGIALMNALKDYHTCTENMGRIPQFVGKLQAIDDLGMFVAKLSREQLDGKKPIFSFVDQPSDMTPVRLDLYWNPEHKDLTVDWDDAQPYRNPFRQDVGPGSELS